MTVLKPITVTKDFLEDVLKEPIKAFTVQPGCKAGDNVAGSLKSITVTTTSGKEVNLVMKTFPEEMTEENNFVVFMKAFWRENAMYKVVIPSLEEFAKTRGFPYKVPAPKYYKGHNDDKTDYIILEDVRPFGYIMPDKTISLTLAEMTLIMKEFADLHAVSYAFLRNEGERVFKEVDGFQYLVQDEQLAKAIQEGFTQTLKSFYWVAAGLLEDIYPEGAERMKKRWEKSGRIDNTMEHLTDNKIFPTLCHFDLWSNNMLIKHDKSGSPVSVNFIDFQFFQRGNIFSDLLYLVYTSTTPEFRKAHLNTILDVYYTQFSSTMETMKVPLPWGFTRGFFIDQFEGGIMTGFARMTFAIPLQLGMVSKTKIEGEEPSPMPHSEAAIKKMYLDSPKAMARLEALTREMVDLKYI